MVENSIFIIEYLTECSYCTSETTLASFSLNHSYCRELKMLTDNTGADVVGVIMTLSTATEQLRTEGKGQQIIFSPLILMEVGNLAVRVLGL